MFFSSRTSITNLLPLIAVAVIWLIGYMVFTPTAQALSCIQPGSPAEELGLADLVVFGNITDLEMEVVAQSGAIPPSTYEAPVSMTVTINQVFKGEPGDTIEVNLNGYTTWYSEPSFGDFVVLYLTENDKGTYQMPLCGRSVIGEGSGQERLALEEADEVETELSQCHRKGTSGPRTPGFGLPYDPTTNEMIMTAQCSPEEVDITIDTYGPAPTYTYQHGYIFYDNKWEPYNYKLGDGAQKSGSWLTGPAVHSLAPEQITPGETLYFAAYTCKWDGRWKCGCTNSACLQPAWQLQIIDVPEIESITN